jgi:hypothetical protein
LGEKNISIEEDELLRGTTMVSRYDIDFYKYEWIYKESEQINILIKKTITEIFEKF